MFQVYQYLTIEESKKSESLMNCLIYFNIIGLLIFESGNWSETRQDRSTLRIKTLTYCLRKH